MSNVIKLMSVVAVLVFASSLFAQQAPTRKEVRQRRPAADAKATPADSPKAPNYEYFSILNGTPQGLSLHHDTEVGTNDPIDVYEFSIELQVFNSDGDLEPEGLILDNFYTARPVHPLQAPNPHNARDCSTWNTLVQNEIQHRNQNSPTWSYVEFTVAQGARIVQTNEDGAVWWSDDVECWGSRDRFPPF
jgi:hypothetical protein